MYLTKSLLLLLIFRAAAVAQTVAEDTATPARGSNAGRAAEPASSSAATDNTPPGMVAFFMTNACPVGWAVPDTVQGRLIVGVTSAAAVGVKVNSPMAGMTPPEHQHKYSTTVTLGSKKIALANGKNRQGARHGKYAVQGTTDPCTGDGGKERCTLDIPFIQLTVCQKQ